jgi:DNA-binding transcriptional LysR family regulator
VDETAAAFERVDQAIRQASAQAREPRGHLRVAAPLDLFSVFAAERLAVFLARHPAVSLELLLSDEQVDLVSDGVDLALRAGVTRDENLVVRPLGQSLMLVVASPDCVAAHGAPRTLADLTAYPCVASRGRNGRAQWVLHGPQGVATVDVQAHLTVNGMGALVSAARAGLGAALVPQSFAREAMAQGALMHLLPTYHADSAGIFAVYPSRRHPNAVLQAFIDFLLGESQRAASTA